ncbi:redox-sensing transcriptional repressor Rex [candidate division KSB1 bacterium]|nr:redox-sensing transcriptional repressor Rex [candidate division KSB1 bacterium]
MEQYSIPKPAISRLCLVYRILDELIRSGIQTVSSSQIAERLSMNPHNVRKDIGYLGDVGNLGAGYDVEKLKNTIAATFGLNRQRNACVVGLGRLGTAILNYEYFETYGYVIVAGFESNINKIETLRTAVPLFPSYQIADVVRRFEIDLGIIAVPEQSAQKVTDQLIKGGIKGIVNLTPVILKIPHTHVFISNMSIIGDFNYLSALITLNSKTIQ